MKSVFNTILFLLVSTLSFSQSIAGYWTGVLAQRNEANGTLDSVQICYKLDQLDWRLKGTFTVCNNRGDSIVKMVNGKIFKDNNIQLTEIETIFDNSDNPEKGILKKHDLYFSKTSRNKSIKGVVKWIDQVERISYAQVTKLKNLDPPKNKRIKTSKKMITIYLFDTRQSDGDRVTILINNEMVLNNYEVSKDQKKIKIPLETSLVVNKLEFRAENVGRIPPNTATIMFKNGKLVKKFQMSASPGDSDEIYIDCFHSNFVKIAHPAD